MDLLYMGIVGVGGAVAGVCVYLGKKNLDQAGVLNDPIPFSRLAQNAGRCVAVRGRPVSDALYIWRKRSFEHYDHDHSDGRHHGSWHTESTDVDRKPFVIEGEGGEQVRVWDDPSEVHGTTTHYEDTGMQGGLDLGPVNLGGRRTRVVVETLPVTRALTVCGRLERAGQGWAIRRDPSLGLLLSVNDSRSQATHETIKGYLGVLGAPIVWALGSLFSYRYFHPR